MRNKTNKHALAEQDLIDIWLYSFNEWGKQQADHYIDLLDESISRLQDNPDLGADCSHIRKGYRRLTVLEHRVYYYLTSHSIEVVRVLHKRMDEDRNL